jgi:hypothetical protein
MGIEVARLRERVAQGARGRWEDRARIGRGESQVTDALEEDIGRHGD